jgi:hypothetical protein
MIKTEVNQKSRVLKRIGQYNFTITSFSSYLGNVGDFITSPTFEMCEHLWQLRVFPRGISVSDCQEYSRYWSLLLKDAAKNLMNMFLYI